MTREAVILAGGQGTRLRPVTLEIPKPLIPVQGRPILSWLVRLFRRHGFSRVTVIYAPQWRFQFERWRTDVLQDDGRRQDDARSGMEVALYEEREPRGTMGALVHELEFGDRPLVVTNGDELKGLDVGRLVAFHESQREMQPTIGATIALVHVPNPSEYGVAEIDGPRIIRFHEKPSDPPTSLISSGLYVIEPAALREAREGSCSSSSNFLMFEKDLFPRLARQGQLVGCELSGAWHDCGTLERWESAILNWREA